MRVTVNQLITKSNELKELNARFRAEITELENEEQSLKGMWEGEANEAFHTAFNNDKVQMTNFYNAIELYVIRLNEIAAKYQQAEAQNQEVAQTRTYH